MVTAIRTATSTHPSKPPKPSQATNSRDRYLLCRGRLSCRPFHLGYRSKYFLARFRIQVLSAFNRRKTSAANPGGSHLKRRIEHMSVDVPVPQIVSNFPRERFSCLEAEQHDERLPSSTKPISAFEVRAGEPLYGLPRPSVQLGNDGPTCYSRGT